VAYLLKALGGLAAHALSGRVGREQLRVRSLDALELIHERVILGVGDLRRVHNVIEVLVTAQFGAQLLSALGRI